MSVAALPDLRVVGVKQLRWSASRRSARQVRCLVSDCQRGKQRVSCLPAAVVALARPGRPRLPAPRGSRSAGGQGGGRCGWWRRRGRGLVQERAVVDHERGIGLGIRRLWGNRGGWGVGSCAGGEAGAGGVLAAPAGRGPAAGGVVVGVLLIGVSPCQTDGWMACAACRAAARERARWACARVAGVFCGAQ